MNCLQSNNVISGTTKYHHHSISTVNVDAYNRTSAKLLENKSIDVFHFAFDGIQSFCLDWIGPAPKRHHPNIYYFLFTFINWNLLPFWKMSTKAKKDEKNTKEKENEVFFYIHIE